MGHWWGAHGAVTVCAMWCVCSARACGVGRVASLFSMSPGLSETMAPHAHLLVYVSASLGE